MAERITLHKKGYTPLTIRKRHDSGYEMLIKTNSWGGERWEKLPHPLDVIEDNIEKYSIGTEQASGFYTVNQ